MFDPKGLASVVIFCFSFAVVNTEAQTQLSAEQQALIAADRGILDAMSGPKSDVAKISQMLAPEYVDVEDGATHPRAEVLQWEARRTTFRSNMKILVRSFFPRRLGMSLQTFTTPSLTTEPRNALTS